MGCDHEILNIYRHVGDIGGLNYLQFGNDVWLIVNYCHLIWTHGDLSRLYKWMPPKAGDDMVSRHQKRVSPGLGGSGWV
jgi:hypothetical protein